MNASPLHDAAVLIGRFQPFHNGHAALLKAALGKAERVCIMLGSSFQARNAKNPFTWEERAAMIGLCLEEADMKRVAFLPVRDYYDDQRWAKAVEQGVLAQLKRMQLRKKSPRVALIGFHKDASSEYLRRFPRWDFIGMERQGEIDATSVRRIYFDLRSFRVVAALYKGLLPDAVTVYLRGWSQLSAYPVMRAEHHAIEEYRKKWGGGPFVTVDALVTAAGHVLLIRRGRGPGHGLWALPGGFLEGRERLAQGAMRELREETGLDLARADFTATLKTVTVFDHPDRSQRGRVITHVHWFDLKRETLPEVTGADDAALAKWVPITQLPALEAECFEDHFHILDHFLGITG
ncbi:MAG: bifunctional nicotinamide-nucleotide adenylyltransferase/Nudix hydroxylase [Zoogloeaceae bacterium]|jgi:bifunctional NMN adenylyltransferase/nudix hydrolase|nr:bifunctional nicotinamide-nucleotide adenylyltransferase/Nudix hydroxylase [Zoogloeaceae bacterium]